MRNVLRLNEISPAAEKALPKDYKIVKECADPSAIIVRSFSMHDYKIPDSVLCVGRAGAGVNNIPLDACAKKGVVVFNTPGANANAVKELTLCALFLASRKIYDGIAWAQGLKNTPEVAKSVESGKGKFAGTELSGKKLGVVGLGAIGAAVANAAFDLGMLVYGCDPYISVDSAWSLNNNIVKETDLNCLFAECDYITLHIPLTPATKGLINAAAIKGMKDGAALINCSRGELAVNADVIAAVKSGKLSRYVTDFPSDDLLGVENIIAVPHLGASTAEAEDNCAVMAVKQITDFIENGNIANSVNFPPCRLPCNGVCRLTVIHGNVKNVLNSITELISGAKINIANMASQAQGEFAYTVFDLDDKPDAKFAEKLQKLPHIIRVRKITAPYNTCKDD